MDDKEGANPDVADLGIPKEGSPRPYFNRDNIGIQEHASTAASDTLLTREQAEARAKQVAPLDVSAEELTKKMVEPPETPLTLPGTHPVITEELKAFEDALRTGEYAGMKVLGEVYHGGRRGLKVQVEDGQAITLDLGVHEIINAGVIPDPEAADLANSDTALAWVEKVLRSFERNADRKITQQVEDSLTATISSKIPVSILDPVIKLPYDAINPATRLPFNPDPNERAESLSQALIRLVEARVAYHNSGLSARLGLGNLGEEYGGITLNEHREIFNTPGVKDAIMQLEENNGEYYHLGNPAVREATIKDNLRHYFNTDPRFAGTTAAQQAEAAELAFELAIKTMHIHGESGHYTGIRNIHGNYIYFTGPNALEQYARYFEEHWDEIAFYIDRTTGVPIVDAAGRAVTDLSTLPPAVAANAVWNQLGGEGSLHQKGTYHLPLYLENPLTPNRGQAAFLRRYAYAWVNSGVIFYRNPTDTAARTSMVEAIDHYSDDWAKWFVWTARVSAAHKGRGVFADKGIESILNNPFIDANAVTVHNSQQTLPKALENFVKTKEAFVGLPPAEQQRAMSHLLRGLLIYVNSNDARVDGFSFSGWNDTIRRNAINWVASLQLITSQQAAELIRDFGINENRAAIREGNPQFAEGAGGILSKFFGGIFRR